MASLGIGVECYAGHRGEQTPRTLILGGRRIAVADLLDAWLAPDYRYFKLRGADDDEDNVSNLLVGSQVVPAFPERRNLDWVVRAIALRRLATPRFNLVPYVALRIVG